MPQDNRIMASSPHLILASASPRRKALLASIGITPHIIIPADIDETPMKNEMAHLYAKRMSTEKAASIATTHPDDVVLAADTVVACGRRILPKAEDEVTARQCLALLSGKRHRIYTSVAISYAGNRQEHTVLTMVQFKRLTTQEIEFYIQSSEWEGKAGGYAIQGLAEMLIPRINGSYSNVVGLPLEKTRMMLMKTGISPW